MKRFHIGKARLAALAVLLLPAAGAGAEGQRRDFDFGRLSRLSSPALTLLQRAELGIRYLREEIRQPTSSQAETGSLIDHEYVLGALVRAIARSAHSEQKVDSELLWGEFQSSPEGRFRDMVGLALAFAGDRRGGDHSASYLQNLKNAPALREAAAEALGAIQEKRYIPLLVRTALDDPYSRSARSIGPVDGRTRLIIEQIFPVRRGAPTALRLLEAKGLDIGDEARRAVRAAVLKTSTPLPEPAQPPRGQ